MSTLKIAWALARRRAVWGVAIFAALAVGLSSCIMQELAFSQRDAYDAQVAFGKQAETRQAPDPRALLAFGRETDALGSRARPLQSASGAVAWTQRWLVTLGGLLAVLIAIAVVTAADLEQRRLLVGWHPARSSRRPLVVTSAAATLAALLVAAGGLLGASLASVAGAVMWPLGSELPEVVVPSLGNVGEMAPSVSWIAGWLAAVGFMIAVAWFVGRTLTTILGVGASIATAVVLSNALPEWMPLSALPATAGMWFQHRGEIGLVWLWPQAVAQDRATSLDWAALSAADPRSQALLGSAILLIVVIATIPLALRRPPGR